MKRDNPYEMNNENIDELIHDAMDGAFNGGLTTFADAAINVMYDQTKRMMSSIVEYKELMMMYACAMKEIQTKFEILNTEYKVRYQRNPISSISTRLKRTSSITEKLAKQRQAFTLENIEDKILDVAGVRVICPYIDDIYTIAEALLNQDDITLIARKDYIAEPKANGYRSLHLIVEVPVFFAEHKKNMKVEVQIRTIAMDFWASLEHQLKYKQEVPNQQEIIEQLKVCADVISATDEKMLGIREQIEAASDAPTEDDILFEKLSRLDIGIN